MSLKSPTCTGLLSETQWRETKLGKIFATQITSKRICPNSYLFKKQIKSKNRFKNLRAPQSNDRQQRGECGWQSHRGALPSSYGWDHLLVTLGEGPQPASRALEPAWHQGTSGLSPRDAATWCGTPSAPQENGP